MALLIASAWLPTPVVAQLPSPSTAHIAWDLPGSLALLDSTIGVGPITFGMPLQLVPLVLTEVKATSTALIGCRAANTALVVSGMRLYGGIVLVAYRGRVAKLNLGVSNQADAELLLAALQARYGPGKHTGYDTFEWVGKVITLRYVPVIARQSHTVYGSLYLFNNELVGLQQAEEAASRRP